LISCNGVRSLGTAKIPDCQCDPRRGLDDGDTTGPDLRM
jgi:hypothetical protein